MEEAVENTEEKAGQQQEMLKDATHIKQGIRKNKQQHYLNSQE